MWKAKEKNLTQYYLKKLGDLVETYERSAFNCITYIGLEFHLDFGNNQKIITFLQGTQFDYKKP